MDVCRLLAQGLAIAGELQRLRSGKRLLFVRGPGDYRDVLIGFFARLSVLGDRITRALAVIDANESDQNTVFIEFVQPQSWPRFSEQLHRVGYVDIAAVQAAWCIGSDLK